MYIRNDKGMSLVELTVAAFVMAILATGVTKFVSNAQKTSKKVEAKFSELALVGKVQTLLMDKASCEETLAGKAISDTNFSIKKHGGGVSIGTGLHGAGPGAIRIDSISLQGRSSAGVQNVNLVLELSKPNVMPAVTGVIKKISLLADFDSSNRIVRCYADKDATVEAAKKSICEMSNGVYNGTACVYPNYAHDFQAASISSSYVASTSFVKDAFDNQAPKYAHRDQANTLSQRLTVNAPVVANSGLSASAVSVPNGAVLTKSLLVTGTTTLNGANIQNSPVNMNGSRLYVLNEGAFIQKDVSLGQNLLVSNTTKTRDLNVTGSLSAGSASVGGQKVATEPWVTNTINRIVFDDLSPGEKQKFLHDLVEDAVAYGSTLTGLDKVKSYIWSKLSEKFYSYQCPAGYVQYGNTHRRVSFTAHKYKPLCKKLEVVYGTCPSGGIVTGAQWRDDYKIELQCGKINLSVDQGSCLGGGLVKGVTWDNTNQKLKLSCVSSSALCEIEKQYYKDKIMIGDLNEARTTLCSPEVHYTSNDYVYTRNFTSSTITNLPAGTLFVKAYVVGGGGAGGGSCGGTRRGAGGGAGKYNANSSYIKLGTSSLNCSVTVGGGGADDACYGGKAGGASSFSCPGKFSVSASGGTGGVQLSTTGDGRDGASLKYTWPTFRVYNTYIPSVFVYGTGGAGGTGSGWGGSGTGTGAGGGGAASGASNKGGGGAKGKVVIQYVKRTLIIN